MSTEAPGDGSKPKRSSDSTKIDVIADRVASFGIAAAVACVPFIILVTFLWSGLLYLFPGGDSIMAVIGMMVGVPALAVGCLGFAFWITSSAPTGALVRKKYSDFPITPSAKDPTLVGQYLASGALGDGYVWDEVLEYRVWCRPSQGALDVDGAGDYYCAFASLIEAREFASTNAGSDEPVVLILQREYIDEPLPGTYIHRQVQRNVEWPVDFLRRPRRSEMTIPRFFAPDAPPNRLDILLGSE